MYWKVVEARDRRSVVVTTPTSVKSFMLKLVELVHKLDVSRLQRADDREDDDIGAAGGIRCKVAQHSWGTISLAV